MSIKQVWLNLPVKDIQKSKEFFKQIGFIPNPMHEKVEHLGGFFIVENKFVLIYAEPGESQGWMYAFGFIDLDGHRWSMLYMDIKNIPK
jgi:uncharacterized protein